jgi:hypothetical protein
VNALEPQRPSQGLLAMQECAARLRRSLARLATFFPIEDGRLQELTPKRQDDIDAFQKRFEQLVLTLQDQVLIELAVQEGEDPGAMSRRDVAKLMERIGAISSAREFRDCVAVRRGLVLLCPDDPTRQAANLNAAYAAAPRLLQLSEQISRRIAPEGGTDPAAASKPPGG